MGVIDKVLDLLKPVSEKFSTKFLVAIGALAAAWDLGKAGGLEPLYALIGIVVLAVSYFFARHVQENKTKKP